MIAFLIFTVALTTILLLTKISRQGDEIRSLRSIADLLSKDVKKLKEQLNGSQKPGNREKKEIIAEIASKETVAPEPANATEHVSETPSKAPSPAPPPIPNYVPTVRKQKNVIAVPQSSEAPPEEAFTARAKEINWENFLGAKLFAWLGGLALFIGFAFLLKYSFDRDLISPAIRVAAGFITGLGLVGGGMHLKRKTYLVTSQTLCATGIVILYASSFAGHALYQFYSLALAFAMMSAITAGAFILAAGTRAMVVAILGILGGFLTPVLLPSGQDQPLTLFSYVTFLNLGLLSVAFYRRWDFLALLGAVGTVLMQARWVLMFFVPEKVFVAMAVFLWFDVLFLAAFWFTKKRDCQTDWLTASAAAFPFVTFAFTFLLLFYESIALRPGVLFLFLLGADLCLLLMVFLKPGLQKIHLAAGGAVFFILSAWTTGRLTAELLPWALGGSLFFAVLHSAIPMLVARATPATRPSWQPHLFPLLALFLTMVPILRELGGSWMLWPFVLLLNAIILVLAFFTASMLAILAAVVITAIVVLGWIFSEPAFDFDITQMLVIVGAFGAFFSVGSTFVLERIRTRFSDIGDKTKAAGDLSPDLLFLQIPIFSSVLPFLLLILASGRIENASPAPILGMGLALTAISVGLVRYLKEPFLLPVAMGCGFALEALLHFQHFHAASAPVYLGFNVVFLAVFFGMPFLFKTDYQRTVVPWTTAALAGLLHFLLIYDVIQRAYPNGVMGLLPAAMAIPYFFGLVTLIDRIPKDYEKRNTILAWFGGITLFFITLIFPIQFDHEWLTVSWALEGVALVWLFHKIPHPGLRGTGVALLIVTFVRLALNPAVLSYHERSAVPIFNWYLYTYGIAIVCLMIAGRLLAPPRNEVLKTNVQPVLFSLGTILAFLLMNIEIADLFSTGSAITFQFSGDLARGMTYSIAWALFALGLLIVGIWKQLQPVRLSSIGLLGVTLAKLFLFDLSQLDQLYRIGAFIGVAIVLIIASVLYQKWVVRNP